MVIRELPRFERGREGSFRAGCETITANKARKHGKYRDRRPAVGIDQAERFLEQMADPEGDLPASGTASMTSMWSRSSWRP